MSVCRLRLTLSSFSLLLSFLHNISHVSWSSLILCLFIIRSSLWFDKPDRKNPSFINLFLLIYRVHDKKRDYVMLCEIRRSQKQYNKEWRDYERSAARCLARQWLQLLLCVTMSSFPPNVDRILHQGTHSNFAPHSEQKPGFVTCGPMGIKCFAWIVGFVARCETVSNTLQSLHIFLRYHLD